MGPHAVETDLARIALALLIGFLLAAPWETVAWNFPGLGGWEPDRWAWVRHACASVAGARRAERIEPSARPTKSAARPKSLNPLT